jgi:hypothetical protein
MGAVAYHHSALIHIPRVAGRVDVRISRRWVRRRSRAKQRPYRRRMSRLAVGGGGRPWSAMFDEDAFEDLGANVVRVELVIGLVRLRESVQH